MGKVTVKLTFDKRHLYAILAVVVMLASLNVAVAVFSRSEGWHPLKQITNNTAGTRSVDADEDGVIDYAERLVQGGLNCTSRDGSGNSLTGDQQCAIHNEVCVSIIEFPDPESGFRDRSGSCSESGRDMEIRCCKLI